MEELKTDFILYLHARREALIRCSAMLGVTQQFRVMHLIWLYSSVIVKARRISGAHDTTLCTFHSFGIEDFSEACATQINLKFCGFGLRLLSARISACSQYEFFAIGQTYWYQGLLGMKRHPRVRKPVSMLPLNFRPLPQSTAPPSN